MSWAYRTFARPLLFRRQPEAIHDLTVRWLGRCARHSLPRALVSGLFRAPPLPVEAFGLRFPNPVGLAAGMDKQGEAIPAWEALGFGHCELGGVTRRGQPGNPRPRVFRAVADEAIVNRMGFNNPGAVAFARNAKHWRDRGRWPRHPVGVNLGKSKVTPLSEAPGDYAFTLRTVWSFSDFFVVNVSSPNTPDLRKLQDKEALKDILETLHKANETAARTARAKTQTQHGTNGETSDAPGMKPILVKVAPDLSPSALDDILELWQGERIAGIVATNTTISRPPTPPAALASVYAQPGGLSGRPLRRRSTEVIRHLYRQSQGRLPIVGVGGIFTAEDAWEKIAAGATLLQLYTGLVFEGPGLVKHIVRGLQRRLHASGFASVSEAVGSEAKP